MTIIEYELRLFLFLIARALIHGLVVSFVLGDIFDLFGWTAFAGFGCRMASNWTSFAFRVFGEIISIFHIFNESKKPDDNTRDMREIAQVEFREDKSSIAIDFEGAHFMSTNLVDLNIDGAVLGLNRFHNILGQCGIGDLIMASAPLMLLAIGADIHGDCELILVHFIFFYLCNYRYFTYQNNNVLFKLGICSQINPP